MIREILKRFENPGKLAAGLAMGAVGLFLLWAGLVVACVAGALIAILKYHQHPILAIIWAVVAYRVVTGMFEVWMDLIHWRSSPPSPPEQDPAERHRQTLRRVTNAAVALVVALCAYLILSR